MQVLDTLLLFRSDGAKLWLNMATYLVTGVAGFIASKVAEQLLAAGHTVVGVDNLNDYYDVRLKDHRLSRLLGVRFQLSADPKISAYAGVGRVLRNAPGSGGALGTTRPAFEFHHLDIENLPALEEVFKAHNFAAVFNLAARAGVRYSLEFPELYRRTNVLGEENVLKCQVKHGVRKHVLASSSSVYAGCPMPFTEDAVLGKMQSPYAETKRQAELLALDYHQKHGIDVTALRYFTVFGPAGRPDMAPFRFIKWIDEGTPITLYGDGTQARDFTYVDDIARGTILAGQLFGDRMPGGSRSSEMGDRASYTTASAQTPISDLRSPNSEFQTPGFEIINLGGGNNPLSITAMIGLIEEALKSQVSGFRSQVSKKAIINRLPPSPADMKETWADITKARRLLGWEPEVSPEAGFRWAAHWHMQNSEWLKNISV